MEESVTNIVMLGACLPPDGHVQVPQLCHGTFFGSLANVINLWRSRVSPKKTREGLRQHHHDRGARRSCRRGGADKSVGHCVQLRETFACLHARRARVWRKIGPSMRLVDQDSVECCFQPVGFLHLKENSTQRVYLHLPR